MPPISMFKDRQRPAEMEFGACKVCNEGTKGSDITAALFARFHHDMQDWPQKEMTGLVSALEAYAPGVREELSHPDKQKLEWARDAKTGLFRKVVLLHADGPLVSANLGVFGAKMCMALFRRHVGVALPLDGAIWCQFALNGGMTQEFLDERVKILPLQDTLQQGTKHVGDQFAYRYNCDGRTVLAAVVQFHKSLWLTAMAASDKRIIELFEKPMFRNLPGSVMARPGDLLGMVPQTFPVLKAQT